MRIRPATPDDARAIAEVHVASWRAGYRGLVADEYLAGMSVDQRAQMWEEILAGDPGTTVLVADDNEQQIVGAVAFTPKTGEIGALYVAPGRFRQGIGTQLLEAAHQTLGTRTALWVLSGNDAAIALYRRHGYKADGASATHPGTGLEQLRLARQNRE